MITRIAKILAITVLLVGLLWSSSADYRSLLLALVWAGAIVVFAQAVRTGKHLWMAIFLGVACLFNPILPITLSPSMSLVLRATTLLLFMVSLRVLKFTPKLSIASITDRTPGSESL
jgi:hypothetical protein